MRLEREVVKRDHTRRVVAERAVGEENKRLVRWGKQARKAEEVQRSQAEAARLREAQHAAAKAALAVTVEECVKTTMPEELVPKAARVAEAVANVEEVEAVPSPAREDVDVGGGWRVVGGSVVGKVEEVSWLGGPVGRARMAGLSGVVEKVQALIRTGSKAWGIPSRCGASMRATRFCRRFRGWVWG